MRKLAALGFLALLFSCGVKAAPRPPRPEARPAAGEPNMVRTNSPPDTSPASADPVRNDPSYPNGAPPWQKAPGTPEMARQNKVDPSVPGTRSPDDRDSK